MSPSSTSNSEHERGLVAAPQGRPRAASICVFFLAATLGVGLLDLLSPAPERAALGAEGVVLEATRARASWRNGTRMRLLDDVVNERSNLRYYLGPWMAALMLRFAHEAESNILVGKDGWLFLRRRVLLPDLPVETPVQIWTNIFRTVERRLLARGTRLLVFPVPRRAVAVSHQLPEGLDLQPERDEAFLAALAQRGVSHVNLLEGLCGPQKSDLWSRYDSHWSRRGQLVAAGLIADAVRRRAGFGLEGREDRLSTLDHEIPKHQKAGLLEYAGIRLGSVAQRTILPSELTPRLMPPGGKRARELQRVGQMNAPVWVTGTSYVAGENLVPYLRIELGVKVFSSAERGQYTSEALSLHLSQRKRPSDLLIDMPLDQVFQRMSLKDGVAAVARVSTSPLSVGMLSPTRRVNHSLEVLGKKVSLQAEAVLASADGALAVRAVGRSSEPRAFQVSVGSLNYWLPWDAEEDVCVLPLISSSWQLDGASLQYAAPSGATLDDIKLTLVTPFRAETDRLSAYPVLGKQDSWSVRLPVGDTEPIQALWIPHLLAKGHVDVYKVYSDEDAPQQLLLSGDVHGRTLVMVDLGNLDGVREVLIRGNHLPSDRINAALIPALH